MNLSWPSPQKDKRTGDLPVCEDSIVGKWIAEVNNEANGTDATSIPLRHDLKGNQTSGTRTGS
jgi:hypothetical protein